MIAALGGLLRTRFSVFARGGSLEQVEPVCGPAAEVGGDVVESLDQLADQSLLRRIPDFDEPRFLMLQTIRDFAAERLEASGEAHSIRDRHLQAFIALAQQAQPHLFGPQRKEWLDRLAGGPEKFRSAVGWARAPGQAPEGRGPRAARWW